MLEAQAGLPEVGQLVQVRQRRYAVLEVMPSELTPSPLRGQVAPSCNLITLSSVDDEGIGDELRVVWELEAGAAVVERGSLPEPTGFDEPGRFDAFLNAVRWGAVSFADTKALQAPFRSGVDIEDYQLDPLVRALRMPRANLLIADDVGLGKTIEAGLVVQELILRHRARTVLVVCPSSLQIQWRDQLRDKFGLEFRLVEVRSAPPTSPRGPTAAIARRCPSFRIWTQSRRGARRPEPWGNARIGFTGLVCPAA